MDAEAFMRAHAENACAGKIAEVMADLTAEATQQAIAALAGGPNPPRRNSVTPAGRSGEAYLFDVTYSGDGDKSVSMRETVEQVEGRWKITGISKL